MKRRYIAGIAGLIILVPVIWLLGVWVERALDRDGGEEVIVILKTNGRHMEFWKIVRAGIQEAATEYGIEPAIVGPRLERDIDRQMEMLANAIEQSPDAILLAASDYNRLAPLAELATERGITVVTLDSALNSDAPVSFVATDNVAAGAKAGAEIDALVAEDEKLAILSHIRGVATAIDRERGVRSALTDRDDAMILGTFFSENDHDRAYEITVRIVREYPDLGGIVALNENSTLGAGRALRDLGVYQRIDLVGFDNSREEIEFLEKGIVQALVVQKPFNMGYVGIRTVIEVLRGENVAPVIYTDSVLVREDDIFTEENQKLLFPLLEPR